MGCVDTHTHTHVWVLREHESYQVIGSILSPNFHSDVVHGSKGSWVAELGRWVEWGWGEGFQGTSGRRKERTTTRERTDSRHFFSFTEERIYQRLFPRRPSSSLLPIFPIHICSLVPFLTRRVGAEGLKPSLNSTPRIYSIRGCP